MTPLTARRSPRIAAIVLALGLVAAAACGADRPDATPATTVAGTSSSTTSPLPAGTTPVTTVGTTATTTEPVPSSTTTTKPRRPWPPDADPSPGCTAPGALVPGTYRRTSAAVPGRSSFFVVGPDHEDGYPSPVVFLLHGRSSDGATIAGYSAFAPAAARLGAMLLAPDAVVPARAWTAADIPFLVSTLDELEGQQCVDRNRVWVAGLSLGGFMSSRLACDLPGRFAAVGAVAGFGFDPGRCAAAPAVPVTTFHGTNDLVIPYEGDPPAFTDFEPSRGAAAAAADWATHNACAPEPVDVVTSSEVIRRTFAGCRAETVHYVINAGGHSWPGAAPRSGQGHTTQQLSATTVLADFFARHVRGR